MLGRVLRVHAHAVTFVIALVAGVLLHLNTAPVRRDAVMRVNQILAPLFAGRLTLIAVGPIGLGGVGGVDARVEDPEGRTVLVAQGVHARTSVLAILRSVLFGSGPMVVDLTEADVRSAEVVVDVDRDGELGIARAFLPKTPSDPNSPEGRGVRFTIDRATIGHVWAHGHPVPSNPLAVDADLDAVHGKLVVAPPNLTLDVEGLTLATRGMPFGADARGALTAHLAMPAAGGGEIGVNAAWEGNVAGVHESVTASLDGDKVAATFDAPELSPEAIRAFWPASPITEGGSAHVDAQGTLTRVEIHARVTLGAASIDVAGPIELAAGQHANLRVDVQKLDLNALVPSAPPSLLALRGDVSFTRAADGAIEGETKIAIDPGRIAGEPTPAGAVHGTVTWDAKKGVRADARLSAREPGAPTVLGVHLSPMRGGGLQVAFDADVRAPKLEAIPRLRSALRGRSLFKTHGVIDLERGVITAKAGGEIDDFGQGGAVHAKHASIAVDVAGSLASPKIDVTLHGDVLDVAGYRFSSAHVEAHGPPKRVHVGVKLSGDGAPDLDAEADVALVGGPTLSGVTATLTRGGDSLHAEAATVKIAHGGIGVDGVVITGLGGTLHAAVETTSDTLHVKADGRALDVAALARIARVEDELVGCKLGLDVDASIQRQGAEGRASFDLSSCSRGKIVGVTAHLDASIEGRQVGGHAHLDVPGAGVLDLRTSSIRIGGSAPILLSLRRAWGKVEFEGRMDLAKAAALLPSGVLPVDDVRGTVAIDGKLERDAMDDMTPGLALSAKTSGLALVGASQRTTDVGGSATITPPSWRLEGIDVALDSRIDGDSGFADVDVRLNDAHGELVDLDVKSATVPYANLLATPSRAAALLEAIQLNARAAIPERALSDLPPELGEYDGRGTLAGDVKMTGSILKPTLDARFTLSGARGRGSGLSMPADFDLTARYDGAHAEAVLAATVKQGRVLDAKATGDVPMAELLAGNPTTWTAGMTAHLEKFPLAALAAMSEHEVEGTVTGDISLDGLHRDAKAKVDLTVNALKSGAVTYASGKLTAAVGGGAMDASLRFDQSDGFIDARAHAAAKWGAAIHPTLDPRSALECTLQAKQFRAAILLPYVDNVFTELDARVDADVKAELDPRSGASRLSGRIAVKDGRFELASIGGEFHDASMNVTFTPDGVVRVENVQASGLSGKVEAAAVVRLANLSPVAASANILVPNGSPLLLSVEGTQIGTIVGRMSIAAKFSPDAVTAEVDVPQLHVELPLAASQDVQILGDIPNVRIGTVTPTGFVPERLDAARVQLSEPSNKALKVTVNLGRDVEVKRGATLKVALEGKPTITVTDQVRATGQLQLTRGGRIDVQGKTFKVESGTITFVGDDITNPQVVVTASWTASDGTVVYADFVGPLKSGKVNLRSEPTLPKNEILSLLIFGTSDAAASDQSNASQYAGAGVAGAAAAQPLNQALQAYGLGGVTTKIDTSQINPRPEVEVQIARDISLQVAYVIGTPPPGQAPDTAFLMVDWRFIRQWTLQSTVGDAGTTILDLIWQHRY